MIKQFTEKLRAENSVCIACLGDSVTHGYFASHDGMHSNTDYEAVYHNRLRQKINLYFSGKSVNIINAGVGGDSAAQGLARIERDVLRYAPDLTVVCFGLNDVNGTLDAYTKNLEDIFAALRRHGSEVIFMTPNMLNTRVTSPELADYAAKTAEYQNSGKMDQFMESAIKTAQQSGAAVCDCYGKWKQLYRLGVDTDQLLANHINHPIRALHTLFADALFDTIFWG